MITLHNAQPSDIWPDGSDLTPEAECEIMALAKAISHGDIASSGLVFAEWYKPFYMAEGIWRQRQKQQAERQQQKHVAENDNAKRIARLERRLSKTTKDLAVIWDTLLAATKDAPKELHLFRLIKNIAWKQIVDHKILRDAGIWKSEKLYGPGAAVTHDGQLWVAQQESKAVEPGDGVCWRLTHKSDLSEVRGFVRTAVRDELYKQKGPKT
jgi:hypothetical protein